MNTDFTAALNQLAASPGETQENMAAIAGGILDLAAQPSMDERINAACGGRGFDELSDSGLLWLINRTVFHPRGFALGLVHGEGGKVIGWTLLGDGKEPWRYANSESEDRGFTRSEATLQASRDNPR